MKTKKLFPGSAFLMLSLLITSCSILSKPEPKPQPINDPLTIEGGTTSRGISTNLSDFTIKKESIELLEKSYLNGNYKIIKNSKGNFSDAKYVEYDLETLKQYINYVDRKADSLNVVKPKIRIAFGQYPSDRVIDRRQKKKYMGYQTVFMVPIDEINGEKNPADSSSVTNNMMRGADGLDYGTLKPPY